MRDTFYRYLPWVLGGLIGFFLFRPPAFFVELGWIAWLLQAALLALALLAFAALTLLGNLPRDLEMRRLTDGDIPGDMVGLVADVESLGFRRVGPPWAVKIAPTATLIGFVHSDRPVYATAFRTGTAPARVAFDFVSILESGRGGLTTNAISEGAVLPAGNRAFRQVLPGQPVDRLYGQHLEGLAWLDERGLGAKAVSASTFEQDFRDAIAAQRQLVLDAPLRGTIVTMWRAATKRVPFVGPLDGQRIAVRQLGDRHGAQPIHA